MNVYLLQGLNFDRRYDQKIAATPKKHIEILSAVVRGSRLQEGIDDPIHSGIGDG